MSGHYRDVEIQQRVQWHQTRMLSFWSATPHLKKLNNVNQICVFPWEKNEGKNLKLIEGMKEDKRFPDKI